MSTSATEICRSVAGLQGCGTLSASLTPLWLASAPCMAQQGCTVLSPLAAPLHGLPCIAASAIRT